MSKQEQTDSTLARSLLDRFGNLLEWSYADKALLFIGFALLMNIPFTLVLHITFLSPSLTPAFFNRPMFLLGIKGQWAFVLCFTVLFLIGWKIRRTDPQNRWRKREAQVVELSEYLKKMFGRYLSTEVMKTLIEDPSAMELGGERRRVTIMMTDLRGFTAQAERLEPEQVVQMLNTYFEIMVDVVMKYGGTINEIIGDALLVIFGAPQEMPHRAKQAVACAIEMQNTVRQVNERNRRMGLPELEMGIGLNDDEVIVGNIGSSKRSKYTVVGSGVNMTSRIESYTVGGQILISETVRKEAGDVLRIDGQMDVVPKGADAPIRIYEVGGISGGYRLTLEEEDPDLVSLSRNLPIACRVLEGKHEGSAVLSGFITTLSKKGAEIRVNAAVEPMTNLKIRLTDVDEDLASMDVYGKVMEGHGGESDIRLVRFTSLPPEIRAYFQALRRYASA